ncbi:MAG: three-Cys-motif partner protein TcmP [Planctomycetota bacterium]|jgi:three-Cys-motif partner protein
MSRQARRLGVTNTRLLLVDGFAGPGTYAGGHHGSPILAIRLVLEHAHDFHVPVSFLFIELDPQRHARLEDALREVKSRSDKSPRIMDITVQQGDCETLLNNYLDRFDTRQSKLGPAFFFLDQFGYSDVSMRLIQRIMNHPQCEVFSYLNWHRMNQFLSDKPKWSCITSAFGGDEWKPVLELPGHERPRFILPTYKNALETKAAVHYIWHFAMCDKNDKLIYWLFFCTNNLRGLEEMKKAMCRVDATGGFRFSDKDNPLQLKLFGAYSPDILAQDLSSSLKGRTLSISQIKEFVLTQTPACLYKTALKLLEEQELLKVTNAPANRRRGAFPDDHMDTIQVKFLSNTPA